MKEKCEVDTQVCELRFTQLDNQIREMHNDIKELSRKVSNGLTDRIHHIENSVEGLNEERSRREQLSRRLQTAFLTLVVAISTAAIYYSIRHYGAHLVQPASIQSKP